MAEFVDIAGRVLRVEFGAVAEIEAFRTWGQTVVVGATVGAQRRAVVLKATAERDVRAETAALRMVAAAGVPAPRLLRVGEQPQLPGGHWIVMDRAVGARLIDVAELELDAALRGLADALSRLHRITPQGYGWLDSTGMGRYGSWSAWLLHVLRADLRTLRNHQVVRPDVADSIEAVFIQNAARLDQRPARLLHGDLGDTETFVDRAGNVTAIVDWADAIIGDPLYDFARFVAGGPADDPRPARMRPTVMRSYPHQQHIADADNFYQLYQVHNAVRNAAWSVLHEPGWVDDLIRKATSSLPDDSPPTPRPTTASR